MKKHYLHLSVYICAQCAGPVIAGWVAVRENEISKETEIREVGSICISCGSRQSKGTEPARVRHLQPVEWEPAKPVAEGHLTAAYSEALNRAELH